MEIQLTHCNICGEETETVFELDFRDVVGMAGPQQHDTRLQFCAVRQSMDAAADCQRITSVSGCPSPPHAE